MSIEELAKYRELNRYQVGWFARQVYHSHGGLEVMEKALRDFINMPNGQIQRIKENILRENQLFV
jgi:hypothetical protein